MMHTSKELPQDDKDIFKQLEDCLEKLRLYSAVVENFPGGIILTDKNLNVVLCNEQQKKLLDYDPVLFADRQPTLLELFCFNAHRGEYGPGRPDALVAAKMNLVEKRIPHTFERVRPDGRVIEIRGVPIAGGGFVTSYNDITERRKSEELIFKLATTDSLTGLANRSALKSEFGKFSSRAQRGEHFAVYYIDLDNFKPVNESLGHGAGDRLLQEIAIRLKATLRAVDVVARYGGDEFVILQSCVKSPEDIHSLASRIFSTINQAVVIDQMDIKVGCSMGISCSSNVSNFENIDDMISAADLELFKSKRAGKGTYKIHGCKVNVLGCNPTSCACLLI